MAIKVPGFSKKAITVLSVLIMIGAGYSFYFLGFVKSNEADYQQKAYRVLAQIGNNIEKKNETNKKNIFTVIKHLKENSSSPSDYYSPDYDENEFKTQQILDKYDSIIVIRDAVEIDLKSEKSNEQRKKGYSKSSKLKKKINEIDKFISQLEIEYNNLTTSYYVQTNKDTVSFGEIKESLNFFTSDFIISVKDSIALNLPVAVATNMNSIIYKNVICKTTTGNFCKEGWYATFKKPLSGFMSSILRTDVFDEFIIINKNTKKIIFQTYENKITISSKDSLFYTYSAQNPALKRTINVGETEYKVFTHNLYFDKSEKQEWILAGCVEQNNYTTKVRSISFWVIINSTLFIILLIFLMPTLKLALMNSIERLHRTNVLMTGTSIIMGTLFLVLLGLISFNYSYEIERTHHNLDELSNEVEENLTEEINLVLKQLTAYDSILYYDGAYSTQILNAASKDYKTHFYPNIYSNFTTTFWTYPDGFQSLQIFPTYKNVNDPIDLHNRDYIKAVQGDSLWSHPNFKEQYYLESITSWTRNEHEIVVSKKGKDTLYNPIIAMASKFKSVIEPILPLGYGFSIINSNGDVIIHSNNSKNLQENFIEESKNNSKLRSAIYSRTSLKTNIDYLDKTHAAKISPLKGTPLFLIVHYDIGYLKSKISEIWTMSLFLISFSFIIVGTIMILMNIFKKRNRKLLTKQFFFDWMSPKKRLKHVYRKLTLFNCIIGVITLIFVLFVANTNVDVVFILLILPLTVFILIFNKLGVFFSKNEKLLFKSCSLGIFVIINLVFFTITRSGIIEASLFLVYQLLIVLIYIFIFRSNFKLNRNKNSNSEYNVTFKRVYCFFLLSWLVTTAIIPMSIFYYTSYKFETRIWDRYTLLDFTKKIKNQKDRKMNNPSESLTNLHSSNKKLDGLYYDFLGIKFKKDDSLKNTLPSEDSFSKVMLAFRPSYNNDIIKNSNLAKSSSDDGLYTWKMNKKSNLLSYKVSVQKVKDTANIDSQIYINNTVNTLQTKVHLNYFKGLSRSKKLFILILFLGIASLFTGSLYAIISFCITKIYGLDLKRIKYDEQLTIETLKNNNTIIIGLPSSGKTTFINELYKENKKVMVINCTTINHSVFESNTTFYDQYKNQDIVVLDNFEYKNDDHDINAKKMEILEYLQNTGKQIILTSEIEPSEILDMYTRAIYEKNQDPTIKKGLEHELEIWRHILSNFIEIYKPLNQTNLPFKKDFTKLISKEIDNTLSPHEEKILLLMRELKHGSFLQKQFLILEQKVQGISNDEIVLLIQDYVKSYYFALWNALTRKEKFAVYDMSNDGFINTKNIPIINSLLKKGLFIIENNRIDIMNQSFKNFVLSVLSGEEMKMMNSEVRKKGKWNNIKTAIILIIVALVILIGFGKPDFFKSMNKILIAIAGVMTVIPTLTRAFTLTQKIK